MMQPLPTADICAFTISSIIESKSKVIYLLSITRGMLSQSLEPEVRIKCLTIIQTKLELNSFEFRSEFTKVLNLAEVFCHWFSWTHNCVRGSEFEKKTKCMRNKSLFKMNEAARQCHP